MKNETFNRLGSKFLSCTVTSRTCFLATAVSTSMHLDITISITTYIFACSYKFRSWDSFQRVSSITRGFLRIKDFAFTEIPSFRDFSFTMKRFIWFFNRNIPCYIPDILSSLSLTNILRKMNQFRKSGKFTIFNIISVKKKLLPSQLSFRSTCLLGFFARFSPTKGL